jgi:hypothetical protein
LRGAVVVAAAGTRSRPLTVVVVAAAGHSLLSM